MITAAERPGVEPADRGSGTVLGLILALLLLLLMGVALLVGQAAVASQRAANAADLAALAAADTARGLRSGDPCQVAANVAQDNGSQVRACRVMEPERTTVDVRVGHPLPRPLAPLGQAQGVSRAGPPQDSPWAG